MVRGKGRRHADWLSCRAHARGCLVSGLHLHDRRCPGVILSTRPQLYTEFLNRSSAKFDINLDWCALVLHFRPRCFLASKLRVIDMHRACVAHSWKALGEALAVTLHSKSYCLSCTRYVLLCRWLQTKVRTNHGLVAPYAFLDASLEATKSGVTEEDTFFETLMSFSRPFQWKAWCCFRAVSLVAGLCYFVLEGRARCRNHLGARRRRPPRTRTRRFA